MNADAYNGKRLLVGIACNIKTDHADEEQAEFDEPETIAAISAALEEAGCDTVTLEASGGFTRKLEEAAPDIVFNIAEGKSGRCREAQIPAMLEYYGVPFTGSDAAALSVGLDKALTKTIARGLGIATPGYCVISKETPDIPPELAYPVLVKPNAEGSSKGVSDKCVAESAEELRALAGRLSGGYADGLLAESYVDGREFTVGIIGNGPGIRVFEPMEIIFQKMNGPYKIYGYEIKKNFREHVRYECPADVPEEWAAQMKRDAKAVYSALGCRDLARVDFRLSAGGTAYFIEINPLPGLCPGYSDYPMLAGFHGITYNSLIRAILRRALDRYGMKAVYINGRMED